MDTHIAQQKVLVLDDDEGVLRSIQFLLDHHGCLSLTTSGWADALELLETESPDLLLLDLSMPHIDGPSFLRFIRSEGFGLPVIVVSGWLTDEIRDRLRPMGVQAFIDKPFHISEMRLAIDSALGRNGALPGPPAREETMLEPGTDPDAASDLLDAIHRYQSVVSGGSSRRNGEGAEDARTSEPHHRKRHFHAVSSRKRTLRDLLLMAIVCALVAGTLGAAGWYLERVSLESVTTKAVQSLKKTSLDRAAKAAENE